MKKEIAFSPAKKEKVKVLGKKRTMSQQHLNNKGVQKSYVYELKLNVEKETVKNESCLMKSFDRNFFRLKALESEDRSRKILNHRSQSNLRARKENFIRVNGHACCPNLPKSKLAS